MFEGESSKKVFFQLVRAGLWEKEAKLLPFENINFKEVYKLAEEQSVVGLISAGLEHVIDVKLPKDVALLFVGAALQIEQLNIEMNSFVAELIDKLRSYGVYAILVKGQGIAQCYERPHWRACGDVDLLLSNDNYEKAYRWFAEEGAISSEEHPYKKHSGFHIGPWEIELHGYLRGEVSNYIDCVIDEAQNDTFYNGNVSSWIDGSTYIFIPAPNNNVIFVFTHILQHFYRGGIGLRQICDWCRLLWTKRSEIDLKLLEKRLKKMKVMEEWLSFGAFAVDYLGMPQDAMPFYSSSPKYIRKAKRISDFILETGNFGFNRDTSYKKKTTFFRRMIKSLKLRTHDFSKQVMIFPSNAICAYYGVWKTGTSFVEKHIKTQ